MLDKECIPASLTKEGSSGQSSSINANITTPKPNPSNTNKGISIAEDLGKTDFIFTVKVSDLNCIAHNFKQHCDNLCIYDF